MFSIDDQENFDLLAFKNAKYLFYRFNDFVKMYGNHTFLEYVKSMDSYEIQDIEEDMKVNGWGAVEKISEINVSIRMLNAFQEFYTSTGRLPGTNNLIIVPDGDATENSSKVNMKSLYDLFKNTKSHGLVSLPFLGSLLHFFESEKGLYLIKNTTTELYKNLSYMTLSGARNLEFEAVSDFFCTIVSDNKREHYSKY